MRQLLALSFLLLFKAQIALAFGFDLEPLQVDWKSLQPQAVIVELSAEDAARLFERTAQQHLVLIPRGTSSLSANSDISGHVIVVDGSSLERPRVNSMDFAADLHDTVSITGLVRYFVSQDIPVSGWQAPEAFVQIVPIARLSQMQASESVAVALILGSQIQMTALNFASLRDFSLDRLGLAATSGVEIQLGVDETSDVRIQCLFGLHGNITNRHHRAGIVDLTFTRNRSRALGNCFVMGNF